MSARWFRAGCCAWLLCGCSRDAAPEPTRQSAPAKLAKPSHQPATSVTAEEVLGPDQIVAGERLPLLVVLHGLGGSGAQSARAWGLARFADRERVFVLAPDGAQDSRGRRFWNAHPACCDFEASAVDHVHELARRIDEVVLSAPVDAGRVFVLGFSNGGFMALRLACELGDRLRAAASIAGAGPAPETSGCSTTLPHVLLVHGDRDVTVRYEGGSVFDDPALARHASAAETFREWTLRAGCEGTRAGATFDALSAIAGAETEELQSLACRTGSVTLWTVHGGTHAIGGSISLFERIWAYFAHY